MGGSERDWQESNAARPDEPTPPLGIPMGEAVSDGLLGGAHQDARSDEPTPPAGIPGVVGADGVLGSGDFGQASPPVLGGTDPAPEPRAEVEDWPKLEYRSRNKPKRSGALDWIRRRNDSG